MSEISPVNFVPTVLPKDSNVSSQKPDVKAEEIPIQTISTKDDISKLGKDLPKGSVATNISILSKDDKKETNIDVSEKSFNEFNESFSSFVEDGFLDKDEYKKLTDIVSSLEKAPSKTSFKTNERLINLHMERLEKIKAKNEPEFSVDVMYDKKKEVMKTFYFLFDPNYSENDKVAGDTPSEIVSNITQSDALKETVNDGNRCAPSSLLNAYLLNGGKFEDIAKKFGVETELTYKNVHSLQEKLYEVGNTNNKEGFSRNTAPAIQYDFDKLDKLIGKKTKKEKGEIEVLAEKMGFNIKEFVGLTEKKDENGFHLTDIKKQVDKFFKENPNGVLSLKVNLVSPSKNTDDSGFVQNNTGILKSPGLFGGNHAVVVFKEKDEFYLADTSSSKNGTKNSITKMEEKDVNELVYTNRASITGLTLKNNLK